MTLTITLAVNEGMIFATDSRGTIGDPRGLTAQNDSIKKLYKITDKAVLQVSGANETGALVIEEIEAWCNSQQTQPTVTQIMTQLRSILKARYNDWFATIPAFQMIPNQPQRPALVVTLGGYEDINGNPLERIYTMPSAMDFAPQLFKTGIAISGIPQYAIYLTLRLYSRDMPLEATKRLAFYVITETATQDGKVGGPIQMMELKPNDVVREIDSQELKRINKQNESVNLKLKKLFR